MSFFSALRLLPLERGGAPTQSLTVPRIRSLRGISSRSWTPASVSAVHPSVRLMKSPAAQGGKHSTGLQCLLPNCFLYMLCSCGNRSTTRCHCDRLAFSSLCCWSFLPTEAARSVSYAGEGQCLFSGEGRNICVQNEIRRPSLVRFLISYANQTNRFMNHMFKFTLTTPAKQWGIILRIQTHNPQLQNVSTVMKDRRSLALIRDFANRRFLQFLKTRAKPVRSNLEAAAIRGISGSLIWIRQQEVPSGPQREGGREGGREGELIRRGVGRKERGVRVARRAGWRKGGKSCG